MAYFCQEQLDRPIPCGPMPPYFAAPCFTLSEILTELTCAPENTRWMVPAKKGSAPSAFLMS
ncbi:hypothetical protein CVM50_16360 [Pseudooceanicola marinus]|nr:hypothetical protein CVM50_16360 [Pseudooceanicola marinus]